MRSQDTSLEPYELPPSVFMLHRSDFLTKSHTSELKRRFGGQEVLQYLLIDGMFGGAVLGHWRIGPHDVDDIVVKSFQFAHRAHDVTRRLYKRHIEKTHDQMVWAARSGLQNIVEANAKSTS